MQPGGASQLSQIRREFVVRAPEGAGVLYGADLLAMLHKTVPLASLRFIPESDRHHATALREGRVDLDIGTVHDRGPEILSSLLYEQQLVGVARAGHPLLAARVTLGCFAAEEIACGPSPSVGAAMESPRPPVGGHGGSPATWCSSVLQRLWRADGLSPI